MKIYHEGIEVKKIDRIQYTREQQKIIEINNKNLLISASAGSGKTTIMIEKICNLCISEKVDIDKFVILTFTNMAANQMKNKLINQFLSLKFKLKNTDLDFINRQINRIHNANISTIHSFCQKKLKQYSHIVNLNNNYKLLDLKKDEILKNKALELTLNKFYEEFNNLNAEDRIIYINFMRIFSSYKNDSQLKKIIKDLYKKILIKGDYIKECSLFDIKKNDSYYENIINEICNIFYNNIIDKKNILEEFDKENYFRYKDKFGDKDCEKYNKNRNDLLEKLNYFKLHLEKILFNELDLSDKKIIYNKIVEYKIEFINFSRASKNDSAEFKEFYHEKFKEVFKDIKEMILEYKNNYFIEKFEDFIEKLEKMNVYLKILKDLMIDYNLNYNDLKNKENGINFDDLELKFLQVLNNEEILAEIKSDIKYLFVDEYQDISYIQEQILCKLQGNNNLFQVGDAKQSIYGFRNADVSIFIDKYEKYINYKDIDNFIDGNDIVIDLNYNFRSRNQILQAVNSIFSKLMTKEFGKIDYKKTSELKQTGDLIVENSFIGNQNLFDENKNILNKPKIVIINQNNEESKYLEEEFDENKINNENKKEDNALINYIVQRIKELTSKNVQYIKKMYIDGFEESQYVICEEKIDFKDIVILSRKNKNFKLIQEQLLKYGIYSNIDSEQQYFEILEIMDILNFLKIIDNPLNDIELLSVMKSYFGKFTDDEIYEIKKSSDKSVKFYFLMLEYAENSLIENNVLKNKILKFNEKLIEYKYSNYSLKLLIEKILDDFKYDLFILGQDNAEVKLQNIEVLKSNAIEFEKNNNSNIFYFLEYINNLKYYNLDYSGKVNPTNDNVVRMMTIHASKGLEFKYVFLIDTESKINFDDFRKSKILVDDDYGYIIKKYYDFSKNYESEFLLSKLIKCRIESKILEEEMRLLYVAMTRAKLQLEIIVNEKSYKNLNNNVQAQDIYYWINKYADNNNFEINKLSSNEVHTNILNYNNSENGKILFEYKSNLKKLLNNIISKHDKIEQKKEIKNNIIPTKININQLKKILEKETMKIEEEYIINNDLSDINVKVEKYCIDDFIKENKENAAIKKGNYYHYLLEFIVKYFYKNKVDLLNVDLNSIVRLAISKNIIGSDVYDYIEINLLENFVKSDLFSDIMNAKYIFTEKAFLYNYEYVKGKYTIIQGIIDLLYIDENDDIIIIDYKSDKLTEIELKNKYKLQLNIYKNAIEEIHKKNVKTLAIYSVHNSNLIKF